MPLQYPPNSPYNPYEQPAKPKSKALLITIIALAVIIIIAAGVYFYINNFSSDSNGDAGPGDNNSIAVGEPNPNTPICDADVYNCGNFTTQSEAQGFFDACFKDNGDIHRLDADGNGKACERLR